MTRARQSALDRTFAGAPRVPAHCDSWSHFTETRDDVVAAFTKAGLADRLDLSTRP